MSKSRMILYAGIATIMTVFLGCMPEVPEPKERVPILPDVPFDYSTIPAEPIMDNFKPFGDSAIDNEVATLGRVLFYDQRLSHNYRVSCGSCHRQRFAFADNRDFSFGFFNELTGRNTQQLVNAGLQGGLFWDLRERVLDHMVLQPIANHLEMGLSDTLEMENRIRTTSYYEPLFQSAFGSDEVTTHKIGLALAQFVKSIISVDSKFDQGYRAVVSFTPDPRREPYPNFTDLENLGKEAFFQTFACSQCHGLPNFNGSNPELILEANIGLDVHYSDEGVPGVDAETGEKNNGKFKVPSLRNVALTAPYMHDGRFQTLHEVVSFYNSGIQAHPQLAPELRWPGIMANTIGPVIDSDHAVTNGRIIPMRMHMTGEEREGIVAFLKTLTDYTLLNDPKFSDPFQTVED